ncbi:STAS domain-containing protein [Streptomyces yangpuensis]|uniref:STAS domain-containing protein n=1 Tax=Streptomyces yangpuensis TaxID=1648182 RepID=UPI003634FB25
MTGQPGPDRDNGTQPAVEIVGRVVAVRPVGEIDITTAPALGSALAEALALVGTSRADRIVTDCSQVTFCDSSGLNALVAARLEAAGADTAIHLANPAPSSNACCR